MSYRLLAKFELRSLNVVHGTAKTLLLYTFPRGGTMATREGVSHGETTTPQRIYTQSSFVYRLNVRRLRLFAV
ncbi:hypothetical protein PISMIDRAFT_679077 [Pisolithus microcarpus 441]|uniref:Unplaced genomic scaffold scaffold_40, whole genome shotgun sequence n=1 Tax=Pisolithus microcarpus 441 TaxID=765257 RepID=A0A0C9Z3H2_9AGAM|nr:hypothetical protein PISMIDRAFT_679077 [Pisolithus microcarpus 441]